MDGKAETCKYGRMNTIVRISLAITVLSLLSAKAIAQSPDFSAVNPVIEALQVDEAEFVEAVKKTDPAKLLLISWRNRVAALVFVKSDPPVNLNEASAPAKLRKAYVACANAHSTLGILAGTAADTLLTNAGGDNTEQHNITRRGSMDFFLEPYHNKRLECATQTGVAMQPSPLGLTADSLLLPYLLLPATPFSADAKEAWWHVLDGFKQHEERLTKALVKSDPDELVAIVYPLFMFRQMLALADNSALSASDYQIVNECQWLTLHFVSLLDMAKDALTRPEIRVEIMRNAPDSLEQYRATKVTCAAALGAPQATGLAHLSDAAFKTP
jgi:hypothetical protein